MKLKFGFSVSEVRAGYNGLTDGVGKFKCRFQIKRDVFRCYVDIGKVWIINIHFDKLSLKFGFSVCKVWPGFKGLTHGIGKCQCRFKIIDMFFKCY